MLDLPAASPGDGVAEVESFIAIKAHTLARVKHDGPLARGDRSARSHDDGGLTALRVKRSWEEVENEFENDRPPKKYRRWHTNFSWKLLAASIRAQSSKHNSDLYYSRGELRDGDPVPTSLESKALPTGVFLRREQKGLRRIANAMFQVPSNRLRSLATGAIRLYEHPVSQVGTGRSRAPRPSHRPLIQSGGLHEGCLVH